MDCKNDSFEERLLKLEKQMNELEIFVLLKDKSVRKEMKNKICENLKGEARSKALKQFREFEE